MNFLTSITERQRHIILGAVTVAMALIAWLSFSHLNHKTYTYGKITSYSATTPSTRVPVTTLPSLPFTGPTTTVPVRATVATTQVNPTAVIGITTSIGGSVAAVGGLIVSIVALKKGK